MKKGWLKIALPHIIAVAVFLVVALLFCKPALDGKVLNQHDIVGAKGMAQSAWEYREKHGQFPLWNTHIFSGMPNYQVAIQGPNVLVDFTAILTLGLPKPISFFFLACICFYILAIAFNINPWIGMFSALAFAYTTYDPIIISAGHDTKMMAIAYMPALLAGLVWLFHKRYWLGLAVTALFATMEILANHPQINYYFFIVAACMAISYAIIWIKRGEWKHMAIAFSLAIVGALIGIGNSAVTFFTTAEYAKYTMRGGKTIETNQTGQVVEKQTKGLDPDYALSYSFRKSEPVTLFMPNVFGSSSSEVYEEDSRFVEELVDKNIPEATAVQLAAQMPKYWGGISGRSESTAGPVYAGALTCLLFVIGLALLRTHHRWWILSAVVIALLLSWGRYFEGFNMFLLENLPMYNKFRAPSMSMVIPQFLIPLLAGLALHQVLFQEKTEEEKKNFFKHSLYAIGGLVALVGIIYIVNDYRSEIDGEILKAYGDENGRPVVNALKDARQAMFGSGITRLIGFAILLIGLLFLWKKKIIPALAVIATLAVVNTIDLVSVGKKYLNEDNYVDKDAYTGVNFQPTQTDQAILADKDPHFRVYQLTGDRFASSPTTARSMYYHRSVGGYHPAKLRIYQDLIETQLSKDSLNMAVLNMLDTKYFLVPNQQGNEIAGAQQNPDALGAAWFVKELKPVNGPAEEMKALDNFDPKQTAFFDQKLQKINPAITYDSSGTIALTKYDNDTIEYQVKTPTAQFAVFSEIYYPAGWNAYIDGKKTDYYKVNYLLRGMPVPAGDHKITFRFEPASYKQAYQMSLWSGIILYVFLLVAILAGVREWRSRKPEVVVKETKVKKS
jgi:hypothetical protein